MSSNCCTLLSKCVSMIVNTIGLVMTNQMRTMDFGRFTIAFDTSEDGDTSHRHLSALFDDRFIERFLSYLSSSAKWRRRSLAGWSVSIGSVLNRIGWSEPNHVHVRQNNQAILNHLFDNLYYLANSFRSFR